MFSNEQVHLHLTIEKYESLTKLANHMNMEIVICSKYDHSVTIQGLRVKHSGSDDDDDDDNSLLFQSTSEV